MQPTITRTTAPMLLILLVYLHVLPTAESWSLYRSRPKIKSLIRAPSSLIPPIAKAPSEAVISESEHNLNGKQQPPQLNGKQDPRPASYIPKPPWQDMLEVDQHEEEIKPLQRNSLVNSATAASLQLLTSFVPKDETELSDSAAQIDFNYLPPKSIQLDLRDLPIIGGMLSGTWAKVAPLKQGKPSIVIGSPKDKFAAIKNFLDRGRLEFDLGGLVTTHVNLDVEPNQKGYAAVKLRSNLIPKFSFGSTRKSDWNRVTNMGNGETYYFNSVTGESQYEEPREL